MVVLDGEGLNPNLLLALAPFVLVKIGAEFGAKLDNILILTILLGLV